MIYLGGELQTSTFLYLQLDFTGGKYDLPGGELQTSTFLYLQYTIETPPQLLSQILKIVDVSNHVEQFSILSGNQESIY